MPESNNWIAKDRYYLWHPYTQMKTASPPLPIVRGKGIYLYTDDGRRLLDGISSWWVNIHGHSHPKLNEALARQAANLEHVIFAGCTHRPAVELAERLIELLPTGLTRVFYSDNGSTAVEVGVKMALQYWNNHGQPQRHNFIALHNAYHGDTVGTMSASEQSIFTNTFQPLLFQVERAHSPYCYRCPLSLERANCQIECLGDLERLLQQKNGEVAGVIVEPMLQGVGGMIVWPHEFLTGVRQLCDRYNTLMIADEVLTGFGRTGRMFACEHAGITPDIICLSKALTAGYLPLGATVATEELYASFLSDDRRKTFFHGHSYTANPLACAVALASLDLFRTENVLDHIQTLEHLFQQRLEQLRSYPCVGDVRGIGGVAAIELVEDKQSKLAEGYLAQIGPQLYSAFLARGLLLRPMGNILYFMPPYVITHEEANWVFDQVESEIRNLAR